MNKFNITLMGCAHDETETLVLVDGYASSLADALAHMARVITAEVQSLYGKLTVAVNGEAVMFLRLIGNQVTVNRTNAVNRTNTDVNRVSSLLRQAQKAHKNGAFTMESRLLADAHAIALTPTLHIRPDMISEATRLLAGGLVALAKRPAELLTREAAITLHRIYLNTEVAKLEGEMLALSAKAKLGCLSGDLASHISLLATKAYSLCLNDKGNAVSHMAKEVIELGERQFGTCWTDSMMLA